MNTHDFWTFLLGVVIGWSSHSLILQLGYRFGIVEFRGSKTTHNSKGEA